MSEYRIRWARVEVCNGYRCWRERRCIAERRVSVLGIWSFWWIVDDADWRTTDREAMRDINHDKQMRTPLPASKVVL